MLDIHNLMADLSQHRPVFHSEADFQFALAWRIHEVMPDCKIRLEFKPYPKVNMYLDIWIQTAEIAIELKFPTQNLEANRDNEYFALRAQGAQDTRRYDFLKDIQRLERVVADRKAKSGFAILLTNDPSLWKPPKQGGWKTTNDAKFRIHKGQIIKGELAWAEQASSGTTKGREGPIRLKGSYHLHWKDYSSLKWRMPFFPDQSLSDSWEYHPIDYSQFRYLAVSVKPSS
ncbi:MAG: hypothetical protein OXI94_10285 [Gemmatimonadota bacterium]|nr:hypothetical protein [Gemmatimonadota bacterium]MDE2952928.1 hypothetical protein [Gemmatimonadota bacterium]